MGSVSPKRETCRTVSWLDSTHVVGAPTFADSARESSMARDIRAQSHPATRKSKLNAWCISSERTYIASRCAGSTHASATSIRSPSYSASTRCQSR